MSDQPFPRFTVEVGLDIVETVRVAKMFERWGDRFLNRFFTQAEQQQLRGRIERMAGLIASKEAASKALGLGLRGLGWREMEVIHGITGKPALKLNGRAERQAQKLGWVSTTVSMTHDGGVTAAVVVALGIDRDQS